MTKWRRAIAASGLLTLGAFGATCTSHAAQYPVHQPVPGGIAVIEIGRNYGEGYEARFGRTPILVLERQGVWFGIVGIDLDTALGNYLISVKSPENVTSLGFYVKPHSYPFKENFAELGIPKDLDAHSGWRTGLDTSFPLISPVNGTRVEQFGSRYDADNTAESVRWAVLSDIKDNDVVAPGRGAIADILDTDGINNFVTIDHGMGLYSWIGPVRNVVKEKNQSVDEGEALGELGIDTVRPHTLYWKVTLNGVAINPELVSDRLKWSGQE